MSPDNLWGLSNGYRWYCSSRLSSRSVKLTTHSLYCRVYIYLSYRPAPALYFTCNKKCSFVHCIQKCVCWIRAVVSTSETSVDSSQTTWCKYQKTTIFTLAAIIIWNLTYMPICYILRSKCMRCNVLNWVIQPQKYVFYFIHILYL